MTGSRHLTSFSLLALLASAGCAAAAHAQRATLDAITHRQTLENGLDVVVVENHAVPIATVEVVVKTGAMSQGVEDQGVPHLFEHMLFKGYRGAGQREFRQEVARIHAGYNGTTSEERVTYYVTLPSSHTDDAVRLLARLVREPRFEKEDLKTERFVVLGEFRRNLSDPRFHLQNEIAKLLWGASWPRKNTIGEYIPLLGVTPERLETIFGRYYVPNNAALVVSGDVSAPLVFEMARDRFGGWERQPDPYASHPVPPMAPLDSIQAVVVTADVSEVTLEIEWQGPSVGADADATYAADVLSEYVNDEQSDFQKRLVDTGLFHVAQLSYRTLDHVGPITFYGTTTIEKLAGALTVLQAELMHMTVDDYFDPELLEIVKKRRSVATAFQLEESTGLAHTIGYWWAVAGLDYYLGYVDHLSSRTPADLHAFVARYLAGKPFVIGTLAPPADAPRISSMMKQYIAMVGEAQ